MKFLDQKKLEGRCMQGQLMNYKGITPQVADDVYIAPGAYVIGDVTLATGSSVWFGSILRGDDVRIMVGKRTNIQDGTIIHGDEGEVIIGDDVTIGHRAVIHGCRIEDGSLIGMGAVVLDGVIVESGAMVAAGAVVSPGKVVSAGTLWAGCPAKEIKNIDNPEMKEMFIDSAKHYQGQAVIYFSAIIVADYGLGKHHRKQK